MRTKGRAIIGLVLAALVLAPAAASQAGDEGAAADLQAAATTVPTDSTVPAEEPVVDTTVAPSTTVAPTTTAVPEATVAAAPPGDAVTEAAPPPPTGPAARPSGPPAATEGEGGDGVLTLTADPSRLRRGRPVTLVATYTNRPSGFVRPAEVEFWSYGEFLLGTAPLDAAFRATLRLDRAVPDVTACVFQEKVLIYPVCTSVSIEIIEGYGVDVQFTTAPSPPVAGDSTTVTVQVTNTGPLPTPKSARSTAEGGLPPPSGVVSVRSGGSEAASGALNASGRATITLVVPGRAPLSVAYSGDDLFVAGTSTATVIPAPGVDPPTTTTTTTTVAPVVPPPPGEAVVTPIEDEEVAPAPVPPPPEDADRDGRPPDDDPVDETPTDDDDGEEAAAAPADSGGGTSAERTSFVRSVPTRDDIEWSAAHVAGNMALALFLLVLVAIPATLVDNTLEENYQRIFGAHPKLAAWVERAEAGLTGVPNGVLLVGLSIVAALIFGQLEFDLGWNATSAVLLLAMALVVAIVVGLHDLIRLPYLRRRAGDEPGRLGVYPFALILAVVLVVLSKLAGFQPGFVFGVLGGLALSDAVDERDDGASLGLVSAVLLGVAFVAWWLWTPVASRVVEPDPGLWTLFLDAFLATLWLTCLQAVVFGLAPVRFLDGEMVKKWNGWAWIGLWGLSIFVMVQCFLHPSAGRWGGLDSNTMRSALSVFVVFFALGVAFWAWFRFRPDPNGPAAGDPGEAEVTVSS